MSQARISIFHGSGQPVTFEEVDLPLGQLEPNQAIVEIETATICGSDIWTYTGARPADVPLTLGHEGVGRVVESTRRDLEPGTRVVWSIVDSCGRCPNCTDYELPQKCDNLLKYGHTPQLLSGTYATHTLLRAGTTILPVSAALSHATASTLCCAWSTAEACLEKIPRETRSVLVVGLGMVGFAAAYIAQKNGLKVIVYDNRQDKLDLAVSMGFEVEIPKEVDAVVEAAGHIEPFEMALRHLRVGGTAVIAGLVHPDTRLNIPAEQVVKNCWTWVGVHNYNPRHLHRALVSAFGFQQKVDADQIFSSPYPLDRLEEAIKEAQSGRWLRVPVTPN